MRVSTLSSFLVTVAPKLIYLVVRQSDYSKSLSVYSASHLVYALVVLLKKHTLLLADQLADICVVDYPSSYKRFGINLIFLSTSFHYRLSLHTFVSDKSYFLSLSSLYSSSLWLEREVWDMFGIFFMGHPDLRRLLTDYGFDGFPLRKDFPLSGYIELRYDDEKMHIVYEPLEFAQHFRYFNSISPWEVVNI